MENKSDVMDWIYNSVYQLKEIGSEKENIVISCNIIAYKYFVEKQLRLSQTSGSEIYPETLYGVSFNIKNHYAGITVYDFVNVCRKDKKFIFELPFTDNLMVQRELPNIAKDRVVGIYHIKGSIDETETYMEYEEAKEIGEHDKSQMFHLYSQGGEKVLHSVCFNSLKNEYDKWF